MSFIREISFEFDASFLKSKNIVQNDWKTPQKLSIFWIRHLFDVNVHVQQYARFKSEKSFSLDCLRFETCFPVAAQAIVFKSEKI